MQQNLPLQRRSTQRGFTLIELLIAMVVMTIGLLALWSMHNAALASNANAYRLGLATTLAQDGLERLMRETYQDTQFATNNSALLDTATCGGVFPPLAVDGLEDLPCSFDQSLRVNGLGNPNAAEGPVVFLRTYHLENIAAGQGQDRLLIRVRVTYVDAAGTRHGVTIGTTRTADQYNP